MSFLENGTIVKDAKNEKYISHTSHLPDERGGAGQLLVPTMERNGQEASDVKHTSHKSHLSHAPHVTQRGSAENIKALLSGNATPGNANLPIGAAAPGNADLPIGSAAPGNADLPIGSVRSRANNKARHQRIPPELPQVAKGLQRRLPSDLPGEVEEEAEEAVSRRGRRERRGNTQPD